MFYKNTHEPNISKGIYRYRNGNVWNRSGWDSEILMFYRYTHEPNISKGNNGYRNGDME